MGTKRYGRTPRQRPETPLPTVRTPVLTYTAIAGCRAHRGAPGVSGASGKCFGVSMEKLNWDNRQATRKAPLAGGQCWAMRRLALGLAAREARHPRRPGWSSTRTAVRGRGG